MPISSPTRAIPPAATDTCSLTSAVVRATFSLRALKPVEAAARSSALAPIIRMTDSVLSRVRLRATAIWPTSSLPLTSSRWVRSPAATLSRTSTVERSGATIRRASQRAPATASATVRISRTTTLRLEAL